MSWERNLDKEIREHIEQAAADYVAQGMDPKKARERARADFGSVALAKEEVRDTRALRWLADFAQDVRYALRGFRRSPGFAVTAIAILALGIGANTAVFTLMHRVLLASLPVPNPQELVEIGCVNPDDPQEGPCTTSYPAFLAFRAHTDVLAGAFAFSDLLLSASYEGSAEPVEAMLASASIHSVLGLSPAAGRLLLPSDDDPAAPPVAVLSHAYWQRRFGGDPGVIGETLLLNNRPVTVVGVTPAAFRNVTFDITPEVTVPMESLATLFRNRRALEERSNWWLNVLARRRPEVTPRQVQAALEPDFRQSLDDMAASAPGIAAAAGNFIYGRDLSIRPAAGGASSEFRANLNRPLRILMAAVAIVLLVSCANLAGLMVSRTATRRPEFAVRLAVGAGRARILRQVITESALLAAAGSAAGFLLAIWIGDGLLRMAAGADALRTIDTAPDASVLGFTMAAAFVAALAVGLLPALRLAAIDPHAALREIRAERAVTRTTRILIPAQVALACVLIVAAALFVSTFGNFRGLDLGYQPSELLTFRAGPGAAGYDADRSLAYFTDLLPRLETLPGVRSVALSSDSIANLGSSTFVALPGLAEAGFEEIGVGRYQVGAGWFATTGVALLRGREFSASDAAVETPLALVNENFARKYFGTLDCLGREFRLGSQQVAYTIVGVVAAARDRGPKRPLERVVYTQISMQRLQPVTVNVRVDGDAAGLLSTVAALLKEADPAVVISGLRTVEDIVGEQLGRERLLAALSSGFGLLALALVAIGLYGLISGTVTARTKELGVRISLGARPASVAWLVTRQSITLVTAGVAIGLGAGAFLARFVESQLYGVTPRDLWAYGASAGALVLAAALAAYLPARRATRVDPVRALRCD